MGVPEGRVQGGEGGGGGLHATTPTWARALNNTYSGKAICRP